MRRFTGWVFLVLAALAGAWPAVAQTVDANATFIEFVEAARLGDVATVKRLLVAGQDVNQLDGKKAPALYHALEARQFETARALVEAGADVKTTEVFAAFPLGWAARAGDAGIVKLMIAKGADPRAFFESVKYGYRGKTPIMRAIEWGRLPVIKELEAAGASWLGGDRGAAALDLACRSGDVTTVEYLLAKGADANAPVAGNVPLDYAASLGDVPLMRALLAKGANVNGISQGGTLSQSESWYRRTALVSAVMNSQPEAIKLLLQSGADAKALGNLPIKWADLLGDAEGFAWLRAAGAPAPEPFAYREWLKDSDDYSERVKAAATKPRVLSAPLVLNLQGSGAGAVALPRETKFAIITTDATLENAESLLAVQLSRVDKAVVLERTKLRAVLKERALMENFGRSPGGNTRVGRLLGADALVVLRAYTIEDTEMAEARIVSVSTGLVTATMTTRLAGDSLETWAVQVATRCRADGERLFTPPAEAKLVAVVPFTAALNNTSSRELERQLGLLVALRLSQLPGVFLVEREELTRLWAEGRAEDQALLKGSWIVQGAIEQSLNDGGVSLKLTLKPGGGGEARELTTGGKADSTSALSESAVAVAAQFLATRVAQSWSAQDEAAEFLRQSSDFLARRMWREAEATATAAWALGLRDDRVLKVRVQAAANRVLFATNYFNAAKRNQSSLSGAALVVSYRAPLLMSVTDDRELGADDYFDKANLMLDLMEPTFARTEATIAGMPYAVWVCGRAWDAATQALRLTEALSYQGDYGVERAELKARLLALNTQAMEAARVRKDAKALHSLIALRMKNLCWWTEGDVAFQAEVRRLLTEAEGWAPPLSEHAVWGPAFAIAKGQMATLSGRSSQSWVLLVREMAKSADVRERFFGTALAAVDDQRKTRVELAAAGLKRDFPALVELDQSIPARVLAMSYKPGAEPSEGSPFECWYYEQTRQVFAGLGLMELPLFSSESEWKPMASQQRELPEQHQFYVPLAIRRMTLINERGPSGYFRLNYERSGLTAQETETMKALLDQARAKFAPLVEADPEMKDATYALRLSSGAAAMRTKAAAQSATAAITLKAPRLPFEEQVRGLSSEEKSDVMLFIGKKSFRDFDQKVWFGGLSAGRTVFYAFNNEGETVDEVWSPPEKKLGYGLHIDPTILGRADRNAHYIVSAGRRYYSRTGEDAPCIVIYDVVAKTWRDVNPPQAFNTIYDIKLFGNKVVYTFLNNPLIKAAGSHSSDDPETRGDPLMGVMQYDLAAGSYELLVSNRRNPSVSPVDGPGRENKLLVRVSANEFMVGKSETHVYNTSTGLWRAVKPEDKKQTRRFSDVTNVIEFDGARWSVVFNRGKGLVFSETKKANPRTLLVAVTFDDTGFAARVKPYEDVAAYYKRASESQWVDVIVAPQGLALRVGPAYYWMPGAQVQAILAAAFKAAPTTRATAADTQ